MNIKPNDIIKIKDTTGFFIVKYWDGISDKVTVQYSESAFTMEVKQDQIEKVYREV